jgi:hypothetical protein
MNYQEPYRIHQINLNNLIYTKIKNTDTKKIIFIKYEENKKKNPLVIQLPSLLNVNDASKITNEYHELEVPLITQESDKAPLLFNFLEDLDKKIMNDAKINSHMWFDTLMTKESINYKKIVKESDAFPNGVIKIKIIKNNDFETMLQIENKNKINASNIPTNYWCKMLIEVYAIVVNSQNNTFSLFLRPIILSFKEKQAKIYNYKFLEDSDSEKDEMDVPDSELSSIFMKQKFKSNDKNNDLTSSQIFIKDTNMLEELNKNKSDSSTSDDNYEKLNEESLSTSSSCKKSSSSEHIKSSSSEHIKSSSTSSDEDKFKKLNELSDSSNSSEEKKNLLKLENELKENDFKENKLKLSESDESSHESSDKLKLTESSSEEEYLTKIKKELDSTN